MQTKRHFVLSIFLGLLSLLALPALAQVGDLESYQGRLPEKTLFYLSWKNVDKFDQLRAANPVLRLLDSPEMKANWQALREFNERQKKAQQAAAKPTEEKKPTSAEPDWQELAPFLTNPGLVAVVMPPPPPSGASAATMPEPAFLGLYDSTGKEELLAEFERQHQMPGMKVRTYDFGGISVRETLDPTGKPMSYEAQVGRWRVGGDNQALVEDWIRAIQQAPERSLKDSAAYQRSRAYRDPNAQLEAFFNLAAWSELLQSLPATKPGGPSPGKVAEALGLNDWDLVLLGLTFEPERVRYQLTGLRSAVPAGSSTILAPSVPEFPSLRFAPENALSYSVSEVSLPATWDYLQRAMTLLVPPEQSRLVEGVQAMLETVLGMKIDELTVAWGTEFSQISYPAADEGKVHSLYVLSVRDQERVVTALRNLTALLGPQITIEEMPGEADPAGITYFHVSRATGAEPSEPQPLLHAALTAEWLLVGTRQDEVEKAARQTGSGRTLRDNPAFQQARARFPAELSSFSYADADRWLESGVVAGFLKEMAKGLADVGGRSTNPPAAEASTPEASTEPEAAPRPPAPEPPEFKIPRGYVKWIFSATWRDAHGIYHTGIIE